MCMFLYPFLAHLSKTYSRGAFRITRCPSCVVNNFFKHQLLLNRQFEPNLAGMFLVWSSLKLFAENSGCHRNQMEVLAHLTTTCLRGAFRVVMCPSCVVNNFFKHLLLPNRLVNLDQTWQECSLGGLLQKLFTEFDSMKNSGCHGNKIDFFKQFFKHLLLWNRWSNFEIISQKCFLGDPFQKLSAKL